jgi:hypothetical protein
MASLEIKFGKKLNSINIFLYNLYTSLYISNELTYVYLPLPFSKSGN